MNKNKKVKQTLLNFKKLYKNNPNGNDVDGLHKVLPVSSSPAVSVAPATCSLLSDISEDVSTEKESQTRNSTEKQGPSPMPTFIDTPTNSSETTNIDDYMEINEEVSDERLTRRISNSTADRKFYSNWLTMFSWLIEKKGRAFCKHCEQSLPNNSSLLKRHNDSKTHGTVISSLKHQTLIVNEDEQNFRTKQKIADLKILMFLITNNLPFSLIDPLIDLIKSIDTESKICQKLKFSRTRGTDTITTLIAEEGTKALTSRLKNQHFSIIIDETTDVSSKKCLALIARYFDSTINLTKDSFLAMLELDNSDAQSVYNCITKFLNDHQIPINNLIGFGADNASVMMGKTAGVQALLKAKNPYIYSLGCTCHSLHLCSSKAAKKLPDSCEKLAQNIYYFFSHSSKRINDFKSFQTSFNVPIHKIMKTSTTRWLALEGVILRIIEQWQPLKHYFILEKFETKSVYKDLASDISDQINTLNLVYFHFLAYILKLTNNLNKEFQSEKPQIYKLLPSVKSFLLMVLHNFILEEHIDENNLNNVNMKSTAPVFKDLSLIYLGPKAELEIKKSDLATESNLAIRENCKQYYVKLCEEIISRFDFNDETLIHIQNIDPENLGVTLVPLMNLYPHLCEDKIDETEEEFRALIFQKFVPVSSNLEQFWGHIFELKNGLEELRFPNLKKFIGGLLSLSHSSAAAGRCFSQLNNIKTKNRNCLKTETINALMIAKQLTEGISLCDWNPPQNLIRKYKLA